MPANVETKTPATEHSEIDSSTPECRLVYDGECPACRLYSRGVALDEQAGNLTLVDARQDSETLRAINAAGLDIDQGMVLQVGNRLYFGADALYMMAQIGSRSGIFKRINYWFFRSEARANLLYPLLRTLRNGLLRILGKRKINNLERPDHDRF